MKKLISILLITCFCMTSHVAQSEEKLSSPQLADSLVWQITGSDISEPSFLAGTIHLMCEEDFTLDPRMSDAINRSKQVYLEIDMDDQDEMAKLISGMISDKSLKDRLSPTHYKQLNELIEKHTDFSISLFDKTKLFGISSMLTMAAMDCPIKTVDVELMNLAVASKLPLHGLETVEDQLAALDSLTPELSDQPWSEEEMAAFGLMPELIEQMVTVYQSQDVTELYDLMNEMTLQAVNGEKQLKAILDDRNIKWVQKIPSIVKESPTFFAVGAGHLAGEKGVINLLREAGYTVTPVVN